MPRKFDFEARLLVEQYYASGPERMRQVIADALEKASARSADEGEEGRERLLEEVKEAEKASELGSE